jgi:hypothetical protein
MLILFDKNRIVFDICQLWQSSRWDLVFVSVFAFWVNREFQLKARGKKRNKH